MKEYPNWQNRQKLLYSRDHTPSSNQLKEFGEMALEKGLYQDALEFFAKIQDEEGLKKIQTYALDEGDAFLFQAFERFSRQEISDDLWNRLGRNAVQNGKIRFARMAFERTENKEELKNLPENQESIEE